MCTTYVWEGSHLVQIGSPPDPHMGGIQDRIQISFLCYQIRVCFYRVRGKSIWDKQICTVDWSCDTTLVNGPHSSTKVSLEASHQDTTNVISAVSLGFQATTEVEPHTPTSSDLSSPVSTQTVSVGNLPKWNSKLVFYSTHIVPKTIVCQNAWTNWFCQNACSGWCRCLCQFINYATWIQVA